MHYLDTLLTFIAGHPGPAYGVIFLISLSESLALVGLLVPGTMIMFGVGAVVATGSLSLFPVLLTAFAGAVIGDGISYRLGRHYKERLVNIRPISRYPELLKKGEALFRRHGGKSVLFGRFVGPMRPIIPMIAGMMGMGPVHFSVVNVLSAMGWALVYIIPGVFFGTSLAVAGAVSTRLAVIVLVLVAGAWGSIRVCRKAVSLFERKGPDLLCALRQWSMEETSTHRPVRYLKRILSSLFFRRQGDELLLGFLILVLLGAIWGFLSVLQDVLAKDPLVIADQAIYHFFLSLRTPWADNVFVAVTELGDAFVNVSLACAVLLVLLAGRCYRTAGFWALTMIGGQLGVQLLKLTIHLPRPMAIYHGASAYGFPSGHTAMGVVLYGFFAVLLAGKRSGTWRWGLFSGVVMIAFSIGISRLYLGAHWFSDVLGGYFIGAGWTAFMGIAWLKKADERLPRRLLGLAAVLVIVVAGGRHVAQRHEKDLAFYSPPHTVRTMPLSIWQADGWRDLPAWRIDMEGEPEQPLTIQWAGAPDESARFLKTKGWRQPPPLNLKSLFGMLAADTPVMELPVLPKLHDGRQECLRLVYPDRNERLVLRLWAADIRVTATDTPILLGTVEEQDCRQFMGLVTTTRDTGGYDHSLWVMERVLADRFEVKPVRRLDYENQLDREHHRLSWGGGVLLVWEKTGR